MELKTTELFKNIKSLPPMGTKEFDDLIEWEKEKLLGGVNINGVFIPPWLYWHINHWHIIIDKRDNYGNISRLISLPDLRDNEWERAEAIELARASQKGYMEVGARQTAKSELEASMTGYSSTLFQSSQSVLVGGNKPDIQLLTEKIDVGFKTLWEGIFVPRLDKDWRKPTVRLGYKDKNNEDHVWSYIMVRNADEGNNTEAPAGTTAKSFIMDEALRWDSILYKGEEEVQIADIQIGDEIYDENGKLTTVTDKIDVGIKDIYEVELGDGRIVNACEDHLWEVEDNANKLVTRVLSTKDLIKTYKNYQVDNRYPGKKFEKLRYSIKNNKPVEYSEKLLKIDPYYLGVWLGDGDKSTTSICSIDDETATYLQQYAQKLGLTYNYEPNNYNHTLSYSKGKPNPLREMLREYGVFNNKHIPEAYLKSSIEQRIALLQGLMDTDGCCDRMGHIEFVSAQEPIANGFYKLCRSLGIRVQVSIVYKTFVNKGIKKKGKKTWRFALYTDLPIFRLSRKLANYNKSSNKKMQFYKDKVSIKNIRLVGKDQAYCIKVDNESKLFLTDNYTVTHNCGKYPFSQTFEAAKPAFVSKFGWRCSPIIVATGGSFDKGADAERFFFHPEANNFVGFFDKETGKTTGKFLSGLYRQDCKYETTLADYLVNVLGKELPDTSELEQIKILVSDKDKARAKIHEEREQKKKDPDRTEYLKVVMYSPLTVEECFMSSSANFYNGELASIQKTKLIENNIHGTPVELTYDGTKITHKEVPHKAAISSYPTKKTEDLDAPIIIWEHPVQDPPYGLYVAGVDPYKFAESATSDSLGAVYIFKRLHDIKSESYQDCFVASYVARPKDKTKWNEQAKLLIKYYNAQTLCENDEMSFIDYMMMEGEGHLLEDQPKWLSEFVPNTTMVRAKGISRQPEKIRRHLRGQLKEYMEEKLSEKKDENGKVISAILGVAQISDMMLLEEISKWNEDGNFDREIAASLAIAQARAMDKMRIKISDVDEDSRLKSYFNKDKAKSSQMFGTGKTKTIKKKRKTSKLFH